MIAFIKKIYRAVDGVLQDFCKNLPAPLYRLVVRLHRMLTYGFMGIINTIVDFGVFYFCKDVLHFPIGLSQGLGFFLSSSHGFMLNRNLTFTEGAGRSKGQYIQYVGVDLILSFLSGFFMDWVIQFKLPVFPVKLVLTMVLGLMHYIIYKFLVFRIKKEDKQ